jgi:hypothetical protein
VVNWRKQLAGLSLSFSFFVFIRSDVDDVINPNEND